jgi:hypothetical protein
MDTLRCVQLFFNVMDFEWKLGVEQLQTLSVHLQDGRSQQTLQVFLLTVEELQAYYHVLMTRHWVWIDKWICWMPITRDYKWL